MLLRAIFSDLAEDLIWTQDTCVINDSHEHARIFQKDPSLLLDAQGLRKLHGIQQRAHDRVLVDVETCQKKALHRLLKPLARSDVEAHER